MDYPETYVITIVRYSYAVIILHKNMYYQVLGVIITYYKIAAVIMSHINGLLF